LLCLFEISHTAIAGQPTELRAICELNCINGKYFLKYALIVPYK
jgi:hypothetical protein